MAENIIEIRIDSFSYDNQPQLKDIKLDIKRGEFIVLTGLSGCGKTTLLRSINGLVPDFYEGKLEGYVKVLGRDIKDYQKGELAKYMGNVFQNPKDQFFSTIAEDEVALVGENLGMERQELKKRVKEVMEKLDILDLKDKSVFEMSGGERQKVAIASTLVYDTDIVLFDEPSASLDYFSTLDLKETMKKLKDMGKTIIVAEHRLFYLRDICDKMIIMKDCSIGKILEQSELDDEVRIENNLRCFDEKDLYPERDINESEKTVDIRNLDIKIGNRILLKNLNVGLQKGECMGIIGTNGVGKTTMAKQLCGLLDAKNALISYGKSKKKRIRNCYYVFQDADSQLFSHTVENELIPKNKLSDKEYLKMVKDYLIAGNLWEKRTDHPQEMSSGEKQRLALLTSLVEDKKLIILDEPTSGLDFKRMESVAGLIKEKSEEVPIIIITHDTELLFKACNTVLMITNDSYKKVNVKDNKDEILSFFENPIIN
ncbi:MAG: ATP-binding cassette domain-containing protein [Tissierellia bacterium]|nr:ATP-binding cassette domain-containing protein [Tissierellia bacterium]